MRRLPLALALCTGLAWGQAESDWERANAERLKEQREDIVPPPPLARGELVALDLGARTSFRFEVDASSVSIGADGIVRYVMVATSPSGVENITFEGLRCSRQYRVYAVLGPDGTWGGRPGEWRDVPLDPRLGQYALARGYFCRGGAPLESAREAVAALHDGGNGGLLPRLAR